MTEAEGEEHITSISKDGQVVLYEVSGDQKPIIQKRLNHAFAAFLSLPKVRKMQPSDV